jgi:acetoin utilization deacetylase AcuC-like enzyme
MPPYNPVTIISHPRYLDHDTGGGLHPETPDRLLFIDRQLQTSPLRAVLSKTTARRCEWQWLTAAHSSSYLFRFEEEALQGRSSFGHPDNQMCYDTYEAAVFAAGAGPTAVDLLEHNETDLVFCSVRPPGHHAERGTAMGFCFINNVVVAAHYWRTHFNCRRILIIDWDAHHGNGIQSAFYEDPDIFYVSIHEHPTFSFPGTGYAEETGSGAGEGKTINLPLHPGAGDGDILKAITAKVTPAVEAFQPQGLIVAAGFDGHQADDMSGLSYSTELYGHLGKIIIGWSRKYCRGKVLTILEGGYHLEALAAGVERYLLGLAARV